LQIKKPLEDERNNIVYGTHFNPVSIR